MKLSTSLLAASFTGFASAFITNSPHRFSSGALAAVKKSTAEADEDVAIEYSIAIPFLERPPLLDGSMAGDVGFDPLGFAREEGFLNNFREAEIKHSRLAMLAAAGWPLSELLDKKLAAAFNLAPMLDASDRAPSPLDGGLGKISPVYWIACLIFDAVIDFSGTNRATFKADGYFPGNLAFDPLGLYPEDDKEKQMFYQTAEIKHGRVAMIAVVGYAIQEYVYKQGVVDETPLFFTPFWN